MYSAAVKSLRRMQSSQLQLLVVVLSVSVLPGTGSAAPHQDMLAQLLQTGEDTRGHQDLSRLLYLRLLSELASPAEREVPSVVDGLDTRDEMVRELPLSYRERKAGCRNFFWKTFTSC